MNANMPLHSQQIDSEVWRDLDAIDVERVARGLMAVHPPIESIGPLLERAQEEIPEIASYETVLRVYTHNPDCLFAIARTDNAIDAFQQPIGFIAQVPLNQAGTQLLFSGKLDTANPDTRYICRQNERPQAIYIWGVYATHSLIGGIALTMDRLSSIKNRTAPLYCKPTNKKSWDFFLALGFRPGVIWGGELIPELLEYRRAADVTPHSLSSGGQKRALYDTVESTEEQHCPDGRLGITVVHRLDDLLKVMSIRSSTYIGFPYAEGFDGNDLTATHLLGYVGNEPAGCIRIRYFADFAKLERLAVVERFRDTRLVFQLIRAAIAFCQAKGYRKFYGHAEPRVLKLWERFGFRARTAEPTFGFSGLQLLEGDLELPLDPDALTNFSDPYVLIRPEGQWDRPGVLDRSAPRVS
jgi:predicted GNAT family N-acyltransferase